MVCCINQSIAQHFHMHIRVTFIAESRKAHQISFIYLVQKITSNILLQKLSRYQDIRGRNITIDTLYSSLSLADWLLKYGITMYGRNNDAEQSW